MMIMTAKILIVEDEGIEALSLQQKLKIRGYDVPEIVYTGEDAVKKAAQISPDLVLMDIMLHGEMDGITAAEQIHASLDIPIIYITAYADENTLQRAKITEPYGYIVKPFKERELQISIEMALYKHQAERELKESRRLLETTLKSIVDGVIATDRTGLITFMNPKAEKLIGWKQEEVLNKELREVFKIINSRTRKQAENPVTRALEGFIACRENHILLIARDGKEVPIDTSAAPIKDDNGNSLGVILVFCEVTKREKMQAALRESEERLRVAKEAAQLGIYDYDVPSGAMKWDERVRELWGVEPDVPITYEVFISGLHPDDRAKTQAAMDRALDPAGSGDYCAEYRVVSRADSIERWVAATGRMFFEQCRAVRLVGTIQDITGRKRTEEALREAQAGLELRVQERTLELGEANKTLHDEITVRRKSEEQLKESLKEKEVLLKEIHHRVKNNMQIISSLLMLQEDLSEDRKIAEMLKDSQNRISTMALVHERLYRSHNLSKIDLKEYIDDLVRGLFQSYGVSESRVALNLKVEDVLLGIHSAIPCGLIINELVSNSLKHAFPDDKNGEINISLRLTDENMIELFVGDNGIGIPEDMDIRKTQSLGLYLVTLLVENQLRGEITLNRERGAEFLIKFREMK